MRRALLALLVVASPAFAKGPIYTGVAFSQVFKDWDRITQADPPGLTIMTPQKLHFVATYVAAPVPCKVGVLQMIMASHGMADTLAKVPISHCIEIAAENGRHASIFVQDVLIPGLEADADIGSRLDLYADLLGFIVKDPRDRNAPIMLLNRFELIEKG